MRTVKSGYNIILLLLRQFCAEHTYHPSLPVLTSSPFLLNVFLLSLMDIQILGLKLLTINTMRRLLEVFFLCNYFFAVSPRLRSP